MKPATIAALAAAMAQRRPVALAKRLSDAAEFVLPDQAAPEALNQAGHAALAANKSATQLIGDDTWFIEARNPGPRLLITGGGHLAQTLLPLAVATGFAVTIIEPRLAFGTAERFPGAEISNLWPAEALAALAPDRDTAIVSLSHDPKLDDPTLDIALRGAAFYIGVLGSRKSQAARLERMRALGHSEPALARIHGPVGLAIGALGAAEIAVSIIAEIIAVRRGGWLATKQE